MIRFCKILFQVAGLGVCFFAGQLRAEPHNALQWAEEWCWMNASLQCIASIDPLYDELHDSQVEVREKYRNLPKSKKTEAQKDIEQTLEYRLWKVLYYIRHGAPIETSPDVLSRVLAMDVSRKMHEKLKQKFHEPVFIDFKSNPINFVTKLLQTLFSSGPYAKLSKQFKTYQGTFGDYVTLLATNPFDEVSNLFQDVLKEDDTKLSDFVIFSVSDRLSYNKFTPRQRLAPPSFTTNKTIDGKERIYELFAAVLGNRAHAVAVVKDDDPASDAWYFYNDHPTPRVSEIDHANFLSTYILYGYIPELLFFRSKEKKEVKTPLQEKLETLGKKLGGLRAQLQSLRDKLKTLHQKI